MTADINTPKQALVIGITGHRSVEETEEVQHRVDLVLEKLRLAYPNRKWIVLSLLAEGTDRIVVKKIRQFTNATAKHVVVLPLSLDEYQKDFSTPESKQEFNQLLGQADDVVELIPRKDRDEGYAQAGQYILENCDVLVAIWDGRPEKGKGGTGEIVRHARQRKLPLAWIRYREPESVNKSMIPLERDHVRICFERFPLQESSG
jgi:uncharacterized phage-like protein YoqJ